MVTIMMMLKRNDAVLNDLPGEFYSIEADDKIPNNFKYPLSRIQLLRIKNKQTEEVLLS